MRSGPTLALCAMLLASACAGCRARREIRVRSEPTGALLRIDQALAGHTPADVSFEHYGVRRLTLYLDGYRTKSREIHVKAPWYSRFPLDLFSEVLLPFGWRDVHEVHMALQHEIGEVSELEFQAVLDRAESLRRAGPAGPRPLLQATEPGLESAADAR